MRRAPNGVAIALLAGSLLFGCRQPRPVTAGPGASPLAPGSPSSEVSARRPPAAPSAAAPRRRPLQGMPLNLVAQIDDEMQLAPVGDAALLSTGFWGTRMLYLIRDRKLQAVEGLNGFVQSDNAGASFWAAGGSWPDDVWLALSMASDAGPSWSWIYQWIPSPERSAESPTGHWALRREHERSVGQVIPWRGGAVLVHTSPHVPRPLLFEQGASWLTPTKSTRLGASSCAGPLPWLGQDDSLLGFGYACERDDVWLEPSAALVRHQWDARGQLDTEHLTLPESFDADDNPPRWRLFIEGEQLLLLNTKSNAVEPRLVRREGDRWVAAGDLPTPSHLVKSTDHALWVLSEGQLMRWRRSGWQAIAHLPCSSADAVEACRSDDGELWSRSESELWLAVAGQLWSTADAEDSVIFLTTEEREALMEERRTWDDRCPYIMVDVVALNGDPLNGEPWRMSAEEGRTLIRNALRDRPELRSLSFFRYDSFGHDCIGARVPDEKTGAALRLAVGSDHHHHFYTVSPHCGPHPDSRPFRVFP